MKRIATKTLFALFLLSSCVTQENQKEVVSRHGNSNLNFINDVQSYFKDIGESNKIAAFDSIQATIVETQFGKKVGLYKELVDLFDPENFNCGCDDKMKKALKKIKPNNQSVSGFIPDVVVKNAFMTDSVYLLNRQGSNVLAHLFQYKKSSGQLSNTLFAATAATVKNFNEINFVEKNPRTYDQFFYTLDCTGFITAAVNASGGVNSTSVKTAASVAISAKKSIFVLGGVMYSPLFQAYKGLGIFSNNDTLRIDVLSSILNEIPIQEQLDNTQILLNSNYQIIFASNSGNASFNGEGSLGVSGNASFGLGSVQGSTNSSGSIDRSSDYTNYKTYVVDKNINTELPNITVKDVKDLIAELRAR